MKILLLSCKNPFHDPRPSRMLSFLKSIGTVFIGCKEEIKSELTTFIIKQSFLMKCFQRFSQIITPNIIARWIPYLMHFKNTEQNFDIIVCHDLILLPFAASLKKKSKKCILIFDAREYYPLEFESSFLWKIQFQRFYHSLCERYLQKCDHVLTVSQGLQNMYHKYYKVKPIVFYSLPKYHQLLPVKVDNKVIKVIYHGAANTDRGIDIFIKAMRYLGRSYHLTLMLVEGTGGEKYMNDLKKSAKDLPVTFKEPIPMENIIEKTNIFDIGLCCFPPSTANLQYSMPNKLFEYIQARLMIVATPLCEMKEFIKTENIGRVTKGFSAKDIADLLLSITKEDIQFHKEICSKKAKFFSNENQTQVLTRLIH